MRIKCNYVLIEFSLTISKYKSLYFEAIILSFNSQNSFSHTKNGPTTQKPHHPRNHRPLWHPLPNEQHVRANRHPRDPHHPQRHPMPRSHQRTLPALRMVRIMHHLFLHPDFHHLLHVGTDRPLLQQDHALWGGLPHNPRVGSVWGRGGVPLCCCSVWSGASGVG